MKAFLLAAGRGSRLRPITDRTPKCMMEVGGQPLLDIWLDALHLAGVEEVLVNLHHLPDIVSGHVSARTAPPQVRLVFEPELLGSAGTLLANREWVQGEELFLALNADNLTDFDLRRLIEFHRHGDELATLAVFRAPDPSRCGVVELDPAGRIVGFKEKPSNPVGDLANAGMYVFHPNVLDIIEALGGAPPADIGYHLLPLLVGRARALAVDGYFRDIGTPESYRAANLDWRPRAVR